MHRPSWLSETHQLVIKTQRIIRPWLSECRRAVYNLGKSLNVSVSVDTQAALNRRAGPLIKSEINSMTSQYNHKRCRGVQDTNLTAHRIKQLNLEADCGNLKTYFVCGSDENALFRQQRTLGGNAWERIIANSKINSEDSRKITQVLACSSNDQEALSHFNDLSQ